VACNAIIFSREVDAMLAESLGGSPKLLDCPERKTQWGMRWRQRAIPTGGCQGETVYIPSVFLNGHCKMSAALCRHVKRGDEK
jgi:hypothetical protein